MLPVAGLVLELQDHWQGLRRSVDVVVEGDTTNWKVPQEPGSGRCRRLVCIDWHSFVPPLLLLLVRTPVFATAVVRLLVTRGLREPRLRRLFLASRGESIEPVIERSTEKSLFLSLASLVEIRSFVSFFNDLHVHIVLEVVRFAAFIVGLCAGDLKAEVVHLICLRCAALKVLQGIGIVIMCMAPILGVRVRTVRQLRSNRASATKVVHDPVLE